MTIVGSFDDTAKEKSIELQRIPSMESALAHSEDQAATMIDFLRARLLSERSVSKAARERVNCLAKKVCELEQRLQTEIHMRKKLEEARSALASKHKDELAEDYRHLFTGRCEESQLDGYGDHPAQQGGINLAASEHKLLPDLDSFDTRREHNDSEGILDQGEQDDDGEIEEEGEDTDRGTSEKGTLAWDRRRSSERIRSKEWALSSSRFHGSFLPSTSSPDSKSPHKRWVGKSVRQIRTRIKSLDTDGDGEAKQDLAKDIQSDEEGDEEVKSMLEHQTELILQFKSEEIAQREWEEDLCEQNRLDDDANNNKDSISEERPSGESNDEECKTSTAISSIDLPHEAAFHNQSHNSSEELMAVSIADFIPGTPTKVLDETISVERPSVNPSQEGITNQLDVASHGSERSTLVSSESKLYASSISSSHGSDPALDGASYQRPDIYFVQSPSTISDSSKHLKPENHSNKARKPTFGPLGFEDTSYGSYKGLMSSSWEEIFQRKIKAQESVNLRKNLSNGWPQQPCALKEERHMHAESFSPPTRFPFDTCDFPYDAYEEHGRGPWMGLRCSMDVGLDRLMDVLEALQVAKHHVQSSDMEPIYELGYSHPPFMSNRYSHQFMSSSPAREVEPAMYNTEDASMAAWMAYAHSPSRQPISMRHARRQSEPVEGQYTWSHHRNSAYPSYTSHHIR